MDQNFFKIEIEGAFAMEVRDALSILVSSPSFIQLIKFGVRVILSAELASKQTVVRATEEDQIV